MTTMKLLILLTITCAVVVTSLPVVPSCGSPPALPTYKAGSDFVHKDYAHGASGAHGSHYQTQGGNTYFDQKENHQKTKQVIESESSSKHNKGGSNFGSSSGGSFGAFSEHGHGSMTAGSQHQQVGYV